MVNPPETYRSKVDFAASVGSIPSNRTEPIARRGSAFPSEYRVLALIVCGQAIWLVAHKKAKHF